MSKLMKQTIVKTIDEMLQEGMEPAWIRTEIEYMFNQQFSDKEWEGVNIEALEHRVINFPAAEKQ